MDADDRELFDRSLAHATATQSGEALDTALAELGWADALAEDPRAAVGLLFEHQGRANAVSAALDRVLADALDIDGPVVLPALGGHRPPGDGRKVQGLGSAALGAAPAAVVVVTTSSGLVRAAVDTDRLHLRPVRGLDPDLGMVEIAESGQPGCSYERQVAASGMPLDPATWEAAMAAGQRALAQELVGASRAMLALARDHAVDRIQFGVPIASFQAVRHRLAESLVAVEGADAAVAAAWDVGTPLAAAMAKAVAGHSARTVARHAQQVLAGVGFTTEHPFHHHLRRTFVLDGLLGSARRLTLELGDQLLSSRQLPPLLPL